MSAQLCNQVIRALIEAQVKTVCVCPGARNAELISACAQSRIFELLWFYEERSASFFALGRARRDQKPCAVITTSGTAVGELLPAIMEAAYSHTPLVAVTADRPRRFRGSGAPQAAIQPGIFGSYAARNWDLADGEELSSAAIDTELPSHVNVCFEDPNGIAAGDRAFEAESRSSTPLQNDADRTQDDSSLREFLDTVRNPIVLVGSLQDPETDAVLSFLRRSTVPFYCEATSRIRHLSSSLPGRVSNLDQIVRRASQSGYEIDSVIRIGGVPTHRFWRDLEDRHSNFPVFSASRQNFSGLGRSSNHLWTDLDRLLPNVQATAENRAAFADFVAADKALLLEIQRLLCGAPESEPGIFASLSRQISAQANLFLGNSLPIREWDLAGCTEAAHRSTSGSRGLNGIDGQISTFLGQCEPHKPNWAILGDLTTLYDLAGPWPIDQMDPTLSANLVIINNGGGKIFERMFSDSRLQNPHALNFKAFAELWSIPYVNVADPKKQAISTQGVQIIEITPSQEATESFWRDYAKCLG